MEDDRRQIRDEIKEIAARHGASPCIYVCIDEDGNHRAATYGDWQTLEMGLRELTAEELWNQLRNAVPDLDRPLDELGFPTDVLEACHSRGITRLTELPFGCVRDALIMWLHNLWLLNEVVARDQGFVSVLAAMAARVLERSEGYE